MKLVECSRLAGQVSRVRRTTVSNFVFDADDDACVSVKILDVPSRTVACVWLCLAFYVPFSRFPHVLSSPTCPASQNSATSTSFGGSTENPCASAHLSGMSGRIANPNPKHKERYLPNLNF